MGIWIIDLDGTLVNPYNWSIKGKEFIRRHLTPEAPKEAVSEAEDHTLSHPLDYPWTVGGIPSVFAEDSYQWRYAQVGYLWNLIETEKPKNDLLQEMYVECSKDEKIEVMGGSREFIEKLFEIGALPIIVTNARTTKAEKFVETLGFGDEVPVYGYARKFIVCENQPIKIGNRTTYADRPHYHDILREIMSKHNAKPRDVSVVGDGYTMDLSLPDVLGMRCYLRIFVENDLKDGFKTPGVFVEHTKKLGIPAVQNLESLTEFLNRR